MGREIKNCCFTGHRPEKLNMSEAEAKERLRYAIRTAIKEGCYLFISGMARGIDMWAAEIVLEERANNPEIALFCASPFEGFEKRWSFEERERYNYIMNNADQKYFVSEHYSKSCFQIRNQFMVDHSQRVIAAYNGEPGGTRNTINYANKKGIEVINIFK